MAFYDLEFPSGANWGTTSEPGLEVEVFTLPSGARERISRWNGASRTFDVGWQISTHEQLRAVYDFFLAVRGASNTFKYKDWFDYSTNPDNQVDNYVAPTYLDQLLGVADGATTTFQMSKVYVLGLSTLTRNIYLPVTGTTVLAIDGTQYTTGFTVNLTAGTVTFTTAPGLSGGLGGTGSYGKDITFGCEFYSHTAFHPDTGKALRVAMDNHGGGSINGLLLQEEVDTVPVYDELNHGGSSTQAFSADLQLTTSMGRVIRLNPSTSGLSVLLPALTGLSDGGSYFVLRNISANTIAVKYNGSTLGTIQATGDSQKRDWVDVYIAKDESNVSSWQGRA